MKPETKEKLKEAWRGTKDTLQVAAIAVFCVFFVMTMNKTCTGSASGIKQQPKANLSLVNQKTR